jgi:hypothetical protein
LLAFLQAVLSFMYLATTVPDMRSKKQRKMKRCGKMVGGTQAYQQLTMVMGRLTTPRLIAV